MKSIILWFVFTLLFAHSRLLHAQTISENYSVQLSAATLGNPPSISISWKPVAGATSYRIFRKSPVSLDWGQAVTFPPTVLGIIDTAIVIGQGYEYRVEASRSNAPTNATGYLYSGVLLAATQNRGGIILVLEESKADSLTAEIDQLELDLLGDGWMVYKIFAGKTESPQVVKNRIKQIYDANAGITTAYLIGHVPVPYSGELAPDGHGDHVGAWAADTYYADLDGNWTDVNVNNTTASRVANRNTPGDGKWDQSVLPSPTEISVGRVDFANMNAFSEPEEKLLQKYLQKAHAFRHGKTNVVHSAIIDDNFQSFAEGFAQNGWRGFGPLVGPDQVSSSDYFTSLNNTPHIWSYGCGGGSYTSAGGIGNTNNFATSNPRGIFTMLFGSYFGDWDSNNNFLRAALASGNTLTNVWAGRPNWFFHHMGMGETIGLSTWFSQNNPYLGNLYQASGFGAAGVHTALMGDPSLRMFNAESSAITSLTQEGGNVLLTWNPTADTSILAHLVYRSKNLNGPFQLLTPSGITEQSWTDTCAGPGPLFYMVRNLRLEATPSGSFFNLSTGIIRDIVVEDYELAADIQSNPVSCAGTADGSLAITPRQGTPPYDIQWSDGAEVLNRTGMESGDYFFTVTDQCGASFQGLVQINSPAPIQPGIQITGETAVDANDGKAWIAPTGGTPPYQYAWSTGLTEKDTVFNLSPGDYSVTITDQNGCREIVQFTIEPFGCDISVAALTQDALCAGGLGRITFTISGGTPPYNFGNTPPGNYPAGSYSYTITDANLCTYTGTFFIGEPSPLSFEILELVDPSCPDSMDGYLKVEATGGTPPYQYQWTNGMQGDSLFNLGAGTLTSQIRDANNCVLTIEVELDDADNEIPTAKAQDQILYLDEGGTVLLQVSEVDNGSFDHCGSVQLAISKSTFSCLDLGIQIEELQVTDESGNMSTAPFSIEIRDTIPPRIICPTSDTWPSCDSVFIFPFPSGTDNCGAPVITQVSGPSSGSLLPTGVTSFTFEAKDVSGNISTCTFHIEVKAPFEIMGVNATNPSCFGLADGILELLYTFSGNGPILSWNIGLSENPLMGLISGNYSVVLSQNGCRDSLAIFLPEPDSLEVIITEIIPASGDLADGSIHVSVSGGTPPYNFLWKDENGISVSTDSNLIHVKSGIYELSVGDGNGCTTSLSNLLVDQLVSVPDLSDGNYFIIFPNPAKDKIHIGLKKLDGHDVRFCLYSISGQVVLQQHLQFDTRHFQTLEIHDLSPGIYYLRAMVKGHETVQKLIVLP